MVDFNWPKLYVFKQGTYLDLVLDVVIFLFSNTIYANKKVQS